MFSTFKSDLRYSPLLCITSKGGLAYANEERQSLNVIHTHTHGERAQFQEGVTCRFQSAGNGYHCKMRFGMTPPCWTTTPFKPPVAISSTKSSNARMVVKKQTQKRRKNKSASSPSRFISGSVSTYLFSLTDCVGSNASSGASDP